MALYFTNITGETVYVAFAWYDPSCGTANQNFRKQGWWALDSSPQMFKAWDVDLHQVNRYAYFYAETANDQVNWSGNGNAWLSVNPDATFGLCAFADPGDDLWVDFIQLDFNWAQTGWDMVVVFWYFDGKFRADFQQHKGRGPEGDDITAGPIAPTIFGT